MCNPIDPINSSLHESPMIQESDQETVFDEDKREAPYQGRRKGMVN